MVLGYLLMVAIGIVTSALAYTTMLILHNRKAHDFFKNHSSKLPTVEARSLLSGNSFDYLYGDGNWINFDRSHAELGKNYGLFFIDKPVVSSTDLDLIKRMVIDNPDENINRMKLCFLADNIETDTIGHAEDEQWRRLRKCILPAFASHKVKGADMVEGYDTVIREFSAAISSRIVKHDNSCELDVDDMFHRFTLALVYKTFYKQENVINFEAETDDRTNKIEAMMRSLRNPLVKICAVFPILRPIFEWILNNFHHQGRYRSKLKVSDLIKRNLQSKATHIEANKASGSVSEQDPSAVSVERSRRSAVDYIIDQYHAGKMSQREFHHSTTYLFFAATKTTSDALARICYLLAYHQEIQTKLHRAIAESGTSAKYLNWVILEALRLYPSVLVGCSRTITKDLRTSDGHTLPKGSYVNTPPFTIHRLKEYWGEDAEEFVPERWENSKSFHPCQYLAFGAGKRNCPGKELAMQVMRMVLVELVLKYKFEKSEKSEGYIMFTSTAFSINFATKPTYVNVSRRTGEED